MPIPAFINPRGGSADEAREALGGDSRFAVREVSPEELPRAVRADVAGGARRILVAGGDGTIRTAAGVVAGTDVEMAILPGGTLNHFARDHAIPTAPGEALEVAASAASSPVDVGVVNGEVFLNTSSVGVYPRFVRLREQYEPRLGYYLASVTALLVSLARLRPLAVHLEVDGAPRQFVSPLVFVGVGERELRFPKLGGRAEGGVRALQVVVVRGGTRSRLALVALAAAARGGSGARLRGLATTLAARCTLDPGRHEPTVSLDGELVRMRAPLEYRLAPGALRVVGARGH
ncbi:MAG TPA: diacylglycerol kinase family protein [Gemmatimonadaceae bacterium]|nr:diacylglycerol kinase family protein [Gemmatimonadaceae bacterium]